jgi:hypothetical protein
LKAWLVEYKTLSPWEQDQEVTWAETKGKALFNSEVYQNDPARLKDIRVTRLPGFDDKPESAKTWIENNWTWECNKCTGLVSQEDFEDENAHYTHNGLNVEHIDCDL